MTVPYHRRRSTRLGRTALGAAGIAAALLLTSGCASGTDAATNLQHGAAGGPGDGSSTQVGEQLGRGLVLVTDAQGNASLVGTLLNMSNDTEALTSVLVDGASRVAMGQDGGAAGQITLPARTSMQFGQEGDPSITVHGLSAPIGRFVKVTLNYRSSGAATTDVLTVPATGPWAGLAPATS